MRGLSDTEILTDLMGDPKADRNLDFFSEETQNINEFRYNIENYFKQKIDVIEIKSAKRTSLGRE